MYVLVLQSSSVEQVLGLSIVLTYCRTPTWSASSRVPGTGVQATIRTGALPEYMYHTQCSIPVVLLRGIWNNFDAIQKPDGLRTSSNVHSMMKQK
jgi:hypothetical protein